MPTPVTCSHCGRADRLPDDWAHAAFQCPGCRQTTALAAAPPDEPPTPIIRLSPHLRPPAGERPPRSQWIKTATGALLGALAGLFVGPTLAYVACPLLMSPGDRGPHSGGGVVILALMMASAVGGTVVGGAAGAVLIPALQDRFRRHG